MALITGSIDLDIISDIGINYVHDDYLVLDYVAGGTDSVDLDIAVALLVTAGTITVTPSLKAVASATLPITATLTVAGVETVETGEATLSISANITATPSATLTTSATLPITGTVTVSAQEFDLAVALLITSAAITATPSATLRSSSTLDSSVTLSVDGVVTDRVDLAISSTLTAEAFSFQFGQVTLPISTTITILGTDIDVDPYNTYRVQQDTRTLVIPEESRLIKVLGETRVNTVAVESREFKILEETRDFKIKRPVFAGSGTRRNS